MALPKLNDSPNFELTIPSMKKKVNFRPFLVKEEKVMLMAMESEDEKHILKTIVDTIDACVKEDIETKKLTTFDVEYIFLKIRAKSVGETSNVKVNCTSCETENEVKVNIEDIEIDIPEVEHIVKLTNDISVELSWPSFDVVLKNEVVDAKNNVDQVFNLIRSCITAIVTEDQRSAAADHSAKELDDFIESMNQDQFAKIRDYVELMPKLEHNVNFVCVNCQTHNEIKVEGMQNFFS